MYVTFAFLYCTFKCSFFFFSLEGGGWLFSLPVEKARVCHSELFISRLMHIHLNSANVCQSLALIDIDLLAAGSCLVA